MDLPAKPVGIETNISFPFMKVETASTCLSFNDS